MSATAWRLWKSWDRAPAFHMGLDEALLEAPDAPVTLRLYTWSPAALSLGYFQRCAEVPEIDRADSVVRRITGGGAIHHANELTFSIAAPATHPLYRGPVPVSYTRVHGLVIRALAEVGIRARLRGDEPLASDRPGSAMCFHVSTPLDIAWNDKKGVGSAQRRRSGRVLHHGSIKLGTSALEGDIATVDSEDRSVSADAFGEVLVDAFARELDVRFEAGEPDAALMEEALARGARYESVEFVRRR